MKRAALFILCFIFIGTIHAQESKKSLRIAQTFFVASAVADAVSTMRLPAGYVEGNPILGKSKPRITLSIAALTALTVWGSERIRNRKLAKVVLWIGTAVHTGAAVSNATR